MPAFALQEHITNWHADITVRPNATLQVKETISFIANNQIFNHGFLREFPTEYTSAYGNNYVVSFVIDEVTLDYMPTPYKQVDYQNGKRIYIGDPDKYLSKGQHTVTITYTTGYQLGFFENYDELYWNVTGNGTKLMIAQASARVFLPTNIPADTIRFEAYTGYQGEQRTAYKADIDQQGTVSFITTKPLEPHQGLTIVVVWPKGYIKEPTFWQRVAHFAADNKGSLMWLLIIILFIIYCISSLIYLRRKEKAKSVVIPLFEPPIGLTPSEVNYIVKKKYHHEGLSADVVNAAVHGALTIEVKKNLLSWNKGYILHRVKEKNEQHLDAKTITLLNDLFGGKDMLSLTPGSYNKRVDEAGNQLRYRLEKSCAHYIYWAGNYLWPIIIVIISGFVITAAFNWYASLVVAIFSFVFVLFFGVLYALRLTRYTPEGLTLIDKIEGFKMFLEATEVERMKIIGTPPERTPELYEKYLPYAMALGVEKAWTNQFTPLFAQMEKAGHPYHPHWYIGNYYGPFGFNSSSFASSINSSATPPISSSGSAPGSSSGSGGSGHSGGGGGGGGGGGW